jgi:hypothetical protein
LLNENHPTPRFEINNQKSTISNSQESAARTVTRFVGYNPIEGMVARSAVAALPLIYRQVLPPA